MPLRKASDSEILKALEKSDGNRTRAAQSLGITERVLYTHLARIKANGAMPPGEGVYQPVPEHHVIRGVSSLVGPEGDIRAQWIKTKVDEEARVAALLEAVKQAFADHPRVPRIPAPRALRKDLMTVYPMGDPHIGMYSWAEETGDDFDCDTAERDLVAAVRHLVECSPPSEQALIVNLGDFFHADDQSNETRQSHAKLDVDTRWTRVLRIGLRIMRTSIETALTKHKTVRVVNEIGNHDPHSSQMLTLTLSSMYERNPRVTFDESPAKFHYWQFGKNLIGIHHGDTVKPVDLGEIMAADRPLEWGASKFRYWYTGHVHHQRIFELPGCTVESFRTLAGKDAWHAASGYRSGRDMQAIILHRDYGEVSRHRVGIEMLRAAA